MATCLYSFVLWYKSCRLCSLYVVFNFCACRNWFFSTCMTIQFPVIMSHIHFPFFLILLVTYDGNPLFLCGMLFWHSALYTIYFTVQLYTTWCQPGLSFVNETSHTIRLLKEKKEEENCHVLTMAVLARGPWEKVKEHQMKGSSRWQLMS